MATIALVDVARNVLTSVSRLRVSTASVDIKLWQACRGGQVLRRGRLKIAPLRHITLWGGQPAYDDQADAGDRHPASHIQRIRKKLRR